MNRAYVKQVGAGMMSSGVALVTLSNTIGWWVGIVFLLVGPWLAAIPVLSKRRRKVVSELKP